VTGSTPLLGINLSPSKSVPDTVDRKNIRHYTIINLKSVAYLTNLKQRKQNSHTERDKERCHR
jgi:hypothetical protein